MEPSRRLAQIDLFQETRLRDDVYFAIDKDGWGRVYDNFHFLGLARPKSIENPTEYTVNIWGKLCPAANFRRRTYPSQKAANAALIRWTEKAVAANRVTATNQE